MEKQLMGFQDNRKTQIVENNLKTWKSTKEEDCMKDTNNHFSINHEEVQSQALS